MPYDSEFSKVGTSFINHLSYADHLCLISLFSSGMQICLIFAKAMHPHTNYYIVDQCYLNYVSRKRHIKLVLHHCIWIT